MVVLEAVVCGNIWSRPVGKGTSHEIRGKTVARRGFMAECCFSFNYMWQMKELACAEDKEWEISFIYSAAKMWKHRNSKIDH